MPKLIRITTVPISLKFLIRGQMKFMKEHGFDVIMMSADGPEIPDVVEFEQCPHILIPLTRQITPLKDLKSLWILYLKLKTERPDIVHTHTPKAGLIGMMAAWFARVPKRIHTVAGLPLEASTGGKRKLLLFIEWLTYKCSTEVWPNSNSLYEFILINKLSPKNKLQVIGKGSSNGIDVNEFDSVCIEDEQLNKIKTKISYNPNFTYLLFVGRIVKDKGIEELVEAFQKLHTHNPNLRLLLVGPLEAKLDPLSLHIMKIIDEVDSIVMTGFSNEVKYYMHLANLFVFPSHREGFPNVPMQAALMNCPVIASRINGNIDIIDHEINGLLHEKGNVNDLYAKIKYALDNPKEMDNLSKQLRSKIFNNYDRKIVQNLILEQYTKQL